MKVKIRPAGKALILSSLTLILLHAIFVDALIMAVALILALALSLSFITVTWRVKELIKHASIKPSSIELKIVAGRSEKVEAKVEHRRSLRVRFKHPLRFCTIKPQPYITGHTLTMEFSPKLAGIYETNELEVEVESPLKAFSAIVKLPFKVSLTVLPRVLPVAIKALELIASLGTTTREVPSPMLIGLGTEYAETRDYLPGEDLRRIDWKATARLQRLMVKKYHQDVGGGVNVVYDLKTAGPVSRDMVAAEFLRVVLALTEQGAPYTITLVSESEKLETLAFKDARAALLTAIKYALKTVEVDVGFLYDTIAPHSAKEVARLLTSMSFEELVEVKEPRFLEDADAIVITCLLGDLTWLMDLNEKLRAKSRQLIVHVPGKVWLDSSTLEEAYEAYNRQLKLLAMLKKNGIEVKII
ncbi:MAG: DUF58 domain-containing protein [Candidatus Nezhaarchaeales archaeon]